MFENILVGVDGSEHALKAAQIAGDLARCLKANLHVIACMEPIPAYVSTEFLEELSSKRRAQAEIILQPAVDVIGEIPGTLSTDILEGAPAEVILNLASVRSIDLIIMGTRGLGRMTGFLFGSQSQKVVANADCPVLLVR